MFNLNSIISKLNKAKKSGQIVSFDLTVDDGDNIQTIANGNNEKCNHKWYVLSNIKIEECVPVICRNCGTISCICQLSQGFDNVPFERFAQDIDLEGVLYKQGTYVGNYIYDHFYPKKKTIKTLTKEKIISIEDFREH